MAARQSGGVGPFGWTLLGFLAGVAATLAIQLILVGRDRDEDQDDAVRAAPPVVAVTPQLPAPKRKAKSAEPASSAPQPSAAASAAPPAPLHPAHGETAESRQMAEDAAAAGMTSRAKPTPDSTRPDGER